MTSQNQFVTILPKSVTISTLLNTSQLRQQQFFFPHRHPLTIMSQMFTVQELATIENSVKQIIINFICYTCEDIQCDSENCYKVMFCTDKINCTMCKVNNTYHLSISVISKHNNVCSISNITNLDIFMSKINKVMIYAIILLLLFQNPQLIYTDEEKICGFSLKLGYKSDFLNVGFGYLAPCFARYNSVINLDYEIFSNQLLLLFNGVLQVPIEPGDIFNMIECNILWLKLIYAVEANQISNLLNSCQGNIRTFNKIFDDEFKTTFDFELNFITGELLIKCQFQKHTYLLKEKLIVKNIVKKYLNEPHTILSIDLQNGIHKIVYALYNYIMNQTDFHITKSVELTFAD